MMGDRYRATIQIWPWPESFGRIGAVRAWLEDEFGAIRQPGDPAILGVPKVDVDRVLSLEVEEALDGVSEFLETHPQEASRRTLVDSLQEAQVSFVFRDVGGEAHGKELSWRPGLTDLRERRVLPGDELALSEGDAMALTASSEPQAVAGVVANYFAPLEKYVELHSC